MKARDLFTTIRTEGGLLPADLLQRLVQRDKDLPGLDDASYHLVAGERLNERISQSWKRLLGAWKAFRAAADALPERDAGTTLTRERWLLILLQELEYGRLPASRAIEIDGKSYAISHFWHYSPIHLVSYRLDLDRRAAGVAGAAHTSPHSLVQEFLNRSDNHLWGFVSNGLRLRILRDNISLTRQAFVEFDLEGMMEGEVYADFVLLWLLCHQSRVEAEKPEECWLEQWARAAQKQGTRALDRLRNGVKQAIKALGRGFLAHPANAALRDNLRSGGLDKQDYYRQLLRLVYRLLFLFVAEDRDLLYDPTASPEARERYTRYYATGRLRLLAARHRGTKHIDLYQGLRIVMEKLGCDDGCPPLALPTLGGFLWSETAIRDLVPCEISNRDFLEAVRSLAFTLDNKILRAVDYKNLGSEELGSIYESLLELHPDLNIDAASFDLTTAGGHERKTTGSYYTPASLIQCLLDSALDPVLDEAARQPNAEEAILALKVCDPACGSGHFLIAAAHRIARRLAVIRTGDEEPAPEATRTALRDVISHCIYAVDVNPMAVELCKVSLWMEALEPGKPLTFLDHHIQCGNSLLGTTPALLAQGIPDDAFKPIEGDDKDVASALRKRNKVEREGQMTFDAMAESGVSYGSLSDRIINIDVIDDSSIAGVHDKEELYNRLAESSEYRKARLVADAWCAAFVWKKTNDAPEPVTHDLLYRLLTESERVPLATRIEIKRIAERYNFFHWYLAFPEVFHGDGDKEEPGHEEVGWSGGFDLVLGNPPWEQFELNPEEFFAQKVPQISEATHLAARESIMREVFQEFPSLQTEYQEASRISQGIQHFIHRCTRYPLSSKGRLNTAQLFIDISRRLVSRNRVSRIGLVVPTTIATGSFTKEFFQELLKSGALQRLHGFDNSEGIFPGVKRSFRFCLLTLLPPSSLCGRAEADFVFFARSVNDLMDPERHFRMSCEDLLAINPNTGTCPVFRFRRDAELTAQIHHRTGVMFVERVDQNINTWKYDALLMFMTNTASRLFCIPDDQAIGPMHGSRHLPFKDCLPFVEAHRIVELNENGQSPEGAVPCYGGRSIQRGARLGEPVCAIRSDGLSADMLLCPGDVLVRTIVGLNAHSDAVVAARVPEHAIPATFDRTCIRLRWRPEVNAQVADLLVGYLNSRHARDWLLAHGVQLTLNMSALQRLEVPDPSAEVLEALRTLTQAEQAYRQWADEVQTVRQELFVASSYGQQVITLLERQRIELERLRAAEDSQSLDYQIRNYYPHPIALRRELILRQESGKDRLDGILECAEYVMTLVALLSMIQVAEGHHIRSGIPTSQLRSFCQQHGLHLDWGKCQALVREGVTYTAKHDNPLALPFPALEELEPVLADTSSIWSQAETTLRTRRNQQSHLQRFPDDEIRDMSEESFELLDVLLSHVPFLGTIPLVYVADYQYRPSGKRIARFQLLQGASVAFQQREQAVSEELPRGVVGFLDQRGIFRLAFPWLIWDSCPVCRRSELFVFNRIEGHQVTYVAMETGHPHHPADLAETMATFVREAVKAS